MAYCLLYLTTSFVPLLPSILTLYYIPFAHTNTCLFTIRFTGVQTWDAIPPVIKQLPNLCLFKKGFNKFLIIDSIQELGSALSTS